MEWIVPICTIIISFSILCGVVYMYKKRTSKPQTKEADPIELDEQHTESSDHCIIEIEDPYKEYKTMSKEIQLQNANQDERKLIGLGAFASVYKLRWRGTFVAVKIYKNDPYFWERESNCYDKMGNRSPYVLRHYASEFITMEPFEFWTIIEYHELGSLHHYLKQNKISIHDMLSLAHCISSGLLFIHTSFREKKYGQEESTKFKPPMAHCDIKSENILLKSHSSCVIGDFGSAVCKEEDDQVDVILLGPAGTYIYSPPEILSTDSESFSTIKFTDFVKGDMYSFALVTWELARRTTFTANRSESDANEVTYEVSPDEYILPYEGMFEGEPNIEKMINLVVTERLRPPLHLDWENNLIMQQFCHIMMLCWSGDPAERPSSQFVTDELYRKILNA